MIIDRLFRSGSVLLIGSLIVVYWIIIADRFAPGHAQGPKTIGEIGREQERQANHIENYDRILSDVTVEMATLEANQRAVMENQKGMMARMDYFLFALIGLGAKALFDLWKMAMEKHR